MVNGVDPSDHQKTKPSYTTQVVYVVTKGVWQRKNIQQVTCQKFQKIVNFYFVKSSNKTGKLALMDVWQSG